MAQHLKPHKSARWKSSRVSHRSIQTELHRTLSWDDYSSPFKQSWGGKVVSTFFLIKTVVLVQCPAVAEFIFFFSIVWLLGKPSLKNGSYIIFRLFFELSGKERNWLIFSVWCWLIVCGGMYLKCCFLDTAVRLFKVLVCNQHSLPIQRGSKEFMFCCWCFRKKSL